MPGRDGTGPVGAGSMTGRGLGLCTADNAVKDGANRAMGSGLGLACRRGSGRGLGHSFGRGFGRGFSRGFGRGFGRDFAVNQASSKTQKELLHEQKAILQERIEVIDKQLENI